MIGFAGGIDDRMPPAVVYTFERWGESSETHIVDRKIESYTISI
jgi:hypothetical protein